MGFFYNRVRSTQLLLSDGRSLKKIREIDRGGFGVVDEVQLADGTRVARKTFAPQAGLPDLDLLKRRFAREVRIQSLIVHPNIMPVLDSGLDDDPPWFTMPLATDSYEKKLARDWLAGERDTKPWADILAAVEELHRLGYVHRDLKPANILLVEGRWVLSDFGLVLPTMRDTTILTGTNAAYGSHHYAAPEQAVDFRNTPPQADIFALGCILHDFSESPTVRVPFSQIRCGGSLSVVIERATELAYARRFPTVTDLRAALFDVWADADAATAPLEQADLVETVQAAPADLDAWRRLLQELERRNVLSHDPLLRRVNAQLILELARQDEVLFGRLVSILCAWAADNAFEWEYCDIVGDRLVEAYRVGSVRLKISIALAALELAVSHNRWHVMRQVAGMLGAVAEEGLVDRLLIEINLNPRIVDRLQTIEFVIRHPRRNWHERIANRLSEFEKAAEDAVDASEI